MPFPVGLPTKTLTFGRYSAALGTNMTGSVKIGFDKAALHVPTGEVIVAGDEIRVIDPATGGGSVAVPVTVTDDLVAEWWTSSPTLYQRLKIVISLPGYPVETKYVDIHPDDPAVMDYDQLSPYAAPGGLTVSRAAVVEVAGLSGTVAASDLATALTPYLPEFAGGVKSSSGTGSPEGVVAAPVGSTWQRSDGTAGACFYVKESGTGNTGWVAK
jgi:hypothetical protein